MSNDLQALERCLKKLPEDVQQLVLLRVRDGKSYEEMSKATGQKAGTLQARVSRAMVNLQKCMAQQGEGSE